MEKASTKYRIGQYLDFLEAKGIHCDFVRRKSLDRAILPMVRNNDILFNQKCLFNSSLAKKMLDNSPYSIFDFDDAIYTRPGKPDFLLTRLRVLKRLKLWLRRADAVTTPNHFLASFARKYSDKVFIIPMALDLGIWRPLAKPIREEIIIGWAGAPVNIPLLERLDPVLAAVCRRYRQARVAVFSGKRPKLSFPFDYYPFKPGQEVGFVRNLDIGLLPLGDDEFAKGKSPVKAIQYLACGVPVVGNVQGATGEILTNENSIKVSSLEEWGEALARLIEAPVDKLREMGEVGRCHAEENHDMHKVRGRLLQVISRAV